MNTTERIAALQDTLKLDRQILEEVCERIDRTIQELERLKPTKVQRKQVLDPPGYRGCLR